MNFYECKIKFDKEQQDGTFKSTSELYLVDALSFTEAEARITLEQKAFAQDRIFEVENIRRVRFNELLNNYDNSSDRWFKSKVLFISLDEQKGVEKRTSNAILIKAQSLKHALDILIKEMDKNNSEYEIANIAETAIMDVYEHAIISTSQENQE